MKTIWKYTILISDVFSLELPQGAKILTVQEQYGKPQIWVLVNSDNPLETRIFRLVGTGHPIEIEDSKLEYIGTFQVAGGSFIGHLFEIRDKEEEE